MNKEFVPYPEALALRELRFDEPCLYYYYGSKDLQSPIIKEGVPQWINHNDSIFSTCYSAPTYSQAFRFFREKYRLHQYIKQYYGEKFYFHIEDMVHPRRWDEYTVEMLRSFNESTSQEESELACLQKLIEIVKNK